MSTRRRAGDPKPFHRKDGRWQLDIQVGHGGRGHRVRRSLYGSSPVEVEAKADAFRRRRKLGLGPVDERLTVAAYLTAWSDGLTGLRPRTLESYRHTVDRHLIPQLGNVSLLELAAADIRRAVRRVETSTGTRTAGYAVTILRVALGVAVRDRLLERNVASDVVRPTSSAPEREVFDLADGLRFLDQVREDRLEAFWTVLLLCGLRRGEATALGWDEVDLEAGTIRIVRTLTYRPGDAYELSAPKTLASRKAIALPGLVVDVIRAHQQRQRLERIAAGPLWREDWAATKLVFTTSRGGPLASSTTSHALHRHLAAAGLPRQRVHDLRHATGSILLELGLDIAYIQELLRHTDITTTRRYSHIRATSRVAADAMDRAFRRPVAVTVAVNGTDEAPE